MADIEQPQSGPPLEVFDGVFQLYEVRTEGDRLLYYGRPLTDGESIVRQLWPRFQDAGYEVRLDQEMGEFVVVAEPAEVGVDGVPWTNIVLALATVVTTLYAGATWYHADLSNPLNLLQGWPFTVGIMTILGVHEFGHYYYSRKHNVDATLPYFIPLPSPIGTLGAVIRMKGRMPDREALFDIGVAGPLAGLVATVAVTTVGLYLPPVSVPESLIGSENAIRIEFGYPLLLEGLSALTGQPLEYADPTKSVNPVVIAGWVGAFVTFLNLIPVGQLDGGHIVRSILGDRQETVAAVVPAVLFGLAAYLYFVADVARNAVTLWVVWGVLASLMAFAGAATPVSEDSLEPKRVAVGVLAFVLGLLCFHPVPIEIIR